MLNARSKLGYVLVFAMITGLVFITGCGNSQEKQQMTEFIQEFAKRVDAYAKSDNGQKGELEAKIKSDMAKWTQMKMDMGSELTPQVLDKLDGEYQQMVKKYTELSKKS